MRLILLLVIVAIGGLAAFRQPFIGLMCFSWLAYLRPQSLAWGANDMRLSYAVGIALLVGCFLNLHRERLFVKARENNLMILLLISMAISTIFAVNTSLAFPKLIQMFKIILIAVLTAGLLSTRERFKYFSWFLAAIFGYFAVKGALRGLFWGYRYLNGPQNSMITDNNEFALVMNMMLPFFLYLGLNESLRWRKILFYGIFLCGICTIVFTLSRGGFVGLCAVSLVFVLKSKRKAIGIIVLTMGAILFLIFAPVKYKERIETIKNYNQDINAMSRLYAWGAAWNMAKDRPLTGVGLRNFLSMFPLYHWFPKPIVAHNSYLQLLAECGFFALFIFLLLLFFSIKKLRNLRKSTPLNKKNIWIHNYSHMLEASFVGYMVSGFFLSRADFDLLYQLIGMVVALGVIASSEKPNKVKK